TEEIYRAWVFNSHISVEAVIGNTDCESFALSATVNATPMVYYDLSTNAEIVLPNEITTEWLQGENLIGNSSELTIFNPPAEVTEYTFRATDSYGCQAVS